LDVYHDKAATMARDADELPSEAARWGQLLEDTVAREFAERFGLKAHRVNQTLQHPENPWMLAHIDRRIVGERALLEIKTTSAFRDSELGDEGSDRVPDEWLVQGLWYLAVTGWDVCHLAALVGGQKLRTFVIRRDPEIEGEIIEGCRKFWHECVLRGIPPEPVNNADVLRLHPEDSGRIAIASADILHTLDDLREVKLQLKELEGAKETLECQIKHHMGDASVLADEEGRQLATWKAQTSTRLDTKALKTADPETWLRFAKASQTRVLRLKGAA
jgi:putative phage-type endonuclease